MNFIYLFFNIKNELLYVGETDNLPRRIDQHMDEDNWKIRETSKILYATCEKESDRKLYEIYYINKLSPKYNQKDVMDGTTTVKLPELEFRELNLMNYQKLKVILKSEKRVENKNIISSNVIHINDFNLLNSQVLTEYKKATFSYQDILFKLKYNKAKSNIELEDLLNLIYGNTNDLKRDKIELIPADYEFFIAYQLYESFKTKNKINLSIKINNNPYENLISYVEESYDNIVIHLNKILLKKINEIKTQI